MRGTEPIDRKKFWSFVDKTAAEVETWPAWKQVLFPERQPVVELKPRRKSSRIGAGRKRKQSVTARR